MKGAIQIHYPQKSVYELGGLCKECSHEWQAPIYHRSNRTGCPKCKPKSAWGKHLNTIIEARGSARIILGLVLELHPTKNGNTTPYEVTATSRKKYWWKCPKGDDYEWEASINNRAKGRGCQACRSSKMKK